MFSNVYQGKRVFITGHTGFKGSWLAAWLHTLGADVTGYALPPADPHSHFELLRLEQRIRHIEGDTRDASHLQRAILEARPEFVFHLAAQPLVRRSYAEPKLTFDTNVGGSVNLLEAVRASNTVHSLVYVTSDKCYRNAEAQEGYSESDELGGDDPYSASKACAELVLDAYQASYFSSPGCVRAASTRAGNVIGGGDWSRDRIVPDCIRALRNNKPIPVRNPHAVRPWQHVLEPLYGYLLLGWKLSQDGRFRGAWNFGPSHGAHRTVDELVDSILEVWGAGSKIGAITVADSQKETNFLSLNCQKAIQQLGWRPVFDFRETVGYTVDWYKRSAGASRVSAGVWQLTESQIDAYRRRHAQRKAVAG